MKKVFYKITAFFAKLLIWVKRADTNEDGVITKDELIIHGMNTTINVVNKIEKENNNAEETK